MNDNSVSNELQGHLRVDLAEPRAYQLSKVGLLSQRRVTSLWHLEHDDQWLIQTLLFSGCQCYPQFFTLDTILRNVDRWLNSIFKLRRLKVTADEKLLAKFLIYSFKRKRQQRDQNIYVNLKMEACVWQVPPPPLKSIHVFSHIVQQLCQSMVGPDACFAAVVETE